MKNQIPPAVIIVSVVVVVAIACFFGFQALFPSDPARNTAAPKGMTEAQQSEYEQARKGPMSQGQSSSSYGGYHSGGSSGR